MSASDNDNDSGSSSFKPQAAQAARPPERGRMAGGGAHEARLFQPPVGPGGRPPVLSDTDSALSPERLQRLREHAWYNDLFLLAPVGYFVIGLDGVVLQANIAGAEMFAIDRRTAPGRNFRTFVAPRFREDFDGFLSQAVNSRETVQVRLELERSRPGCAFPATLLGSEDGSAQACRVIVEYAMGRLDALERSEARLRRIVHSAVEGVWEVDADSITSFVNPAMAAMLGYGIEDMLGRHLMEFIDEEGRALMERYVARRRQGVADRYEFKFVGRDGAPVWTALSTSPIFDHAGAYRGALALVTDISGRRRNEELTWAQASFDALTGLPNRHVFADRLQQEVRRTGRGRGMLALLYVEVDRLRDIHDGHGPEARDRVLQEASRRIAACVRASDTLARLEDDTFAVLLPGLEQPATVERVAQDIVQRIGHGMPLAEGQADLALSASIGIAVCPKDSGHAEELQAFAERAMRNARRGGGNRYCYYTPELQASAQSRQALAAGLREAIEKEQFEMMYQPIVSLATGEVHKAEALLRWRHPTRGLLEPAEFIPYAEASGMIVRIGDWAFRQAARQAGEWRERIGDGMQVTVNASSAQLRPGIEPSRGWLGFMRELGLAPEAMAIEVKESALQQDANERLRQLREEGMQLLLDDFGTGLSSLSKLTAGGLDYVKIDRTFVSRVEEEGSELALCEAIIAAAHRLGLKVVAEGVETRVQCALLTDAGCDYAQGYLFSPPVPAPELEELARARMLH